MIRKRRMLIQITDVIEVHEILNQYCRVDINKFFTILDNTSTRGNGLKLHIRRSRLIVIANIFSKHVVNTLNSLPSKVDLYIHVYIVNLMYWLECMDLIGPPT